MAGHLPGVLIAVCSKLWVPIHGARIPGGEPWGPGAAHEPVPTFLPLAQAWHGTQCSLPTARPPPAPTIGSTTGLLGLTSLCRRVVPQGCPKNPESVAQWNLQTTEAKEDEAPGG